MQMLIIEGFFFKTKVLPYKCEILMINYLLFVQVVFIIFIKMRSWWESCCCLAIQSSPALWNPMNYRPPGSSTHGILQARILEWAVISLSRQSSWPRDRTSVSWIAGRFFIAQPLGNQYYTFFIVIGQIPLLIPKHRLLFWHFPPQTSSMALTALSSPGYHYRIFWFLISQTYLSSLTCIFM